MQSGDMKIYFGSSEASLSRRELEMMESSLRVVLAGVDAVKAAAGATTPEAEQARSSLVALISKLYKLSGGVGNAF